MMLIITLLMGGYTALILAGIYGYEGKLRDLRNAISDYKRALDLSHKNMNNSHYTALQLENIDLRKQVRD